MTGIILTLLIIPGLFLALAVFIIVTYNRLVALRQQSMEGWSGIDVQLKRRSNLTPNLVDTVNGYTSHEKGLLENVTQLRVQCAQAGTGGMTERQQAEGDMSAALGRLFAVAENYPELKADGTFLELQEAMAELEDQIQMSRRYYNGAVRDLNTAIQSFPGNIIAGRFGFEQAEYYEVKHESDRVLPKVTFE